jgi:hypothetical protein
MISLIFLVLNLYIRPYATDGLNNAQICCLLANVFTLFVGIMLIITASLEEAAKRAGQKVDARERDVISIVLLVSNMFVIGLPVFRTLMAGPLFGMFMTFLLGFCKERDSGLFYSSISESTENPASSSPGPGKNDKETVNSDFPLQSYLQESNDTSSVLAQSSLLSYSQLQQGEGILAELGEVNEETAPWSLMRIQSLSTMTPPCERFDGRAETISHGHTADTVTPIPEPTKPFYQDDRAPIRLGSNRAIEYLAPFVLYLPQSSRDDMQLSTKKLLAPFTQLQRLSPAKLFHSECELETLQDDAVSKKADCNSPPFMLLQNLGPRMSAGHKGNSVKAWMNSGYSNIVPENPAKLKQHDPASTTHEGNPLSLYGANRESAMQLDADLIFYSNWTQQANNNQSEQTDTG